MSVWTSINCVNLNNIGNITALHVVEVPTSYTVEKLLSNESSVVDKQVN